MLRLLADARAHCQKGNHEAMLLGEIPVPPEHAGVLGIDAARERLAPDLIERLRSWPGSRELVLGERRALLVHGSPDSPIEGRVHSDSDIAAFADLPYDLVAMGNTHRPFVRRARTVLAVNVGSCGLPRDAGDLPAFAVYDTETNDAVVYRTRVSPDEVVEHFGRDAIPEAVLRVLRRSADEPFGRVIGS